MAIPALLVMLAHAQDPAPTRWVPLRSYRLAGTERFFDGNQRPIAIEVSGGVVTIQTDRALYGRLSGRPRVEMFTRGKAVTWLEEDPRWSLVLPAASDAVYREMASVVPWEKADFPAKKSAIEAALRSSVRFQPDESVSSRKCFVVDSILNPQRPAIFSRSFVDQETGLVVRFEDWSEGRLRYERHLSLDRIEPGAPVAAGEIQPEGRGIIGPVDPSVLATIQTLPSLGQFDADIDKLRREASSEGLRSLLAPPVPTGYRPAAVYGRETSLPPVPESPPNEISSGPELEPGGLPEGWKVAGKVNLSDKTIYFEFSTVQGPGPRALIKMPAPGDDGSAFSLFVNGEGVQFIAFVDAKGTLVVAPGTSREEAESRRRLRLERESRAGATLSCDYVDPETGDSVTVVQSRVWRVGRDYGGLAWSAPRAVTVDRLEEAEIFTVEQPYACTMLIWERDDVQYVVTSTRMKEADLLAYAAKLMQSGRRLPRSSTIRPQ